MTNACCAYAYIFVIQIMKIYAREFMNDSEFSVNGFFSLQHRSHLVFGIIFENLFKFMEKIASQIAKSSQAARRKGSQIGLRTLFKFVFLLINDDFLSVYTHRCIYSSFPHTPLSLSLSLSTIAFQCMHCAHIVFDCYFIWINPSQTTAP